jgi:hypothetical protein
MGAAATFAKAGAVAGVAATAMAGPSLVQRHPAAPVAAEVVTAPPERTPRATRPTPAAPIPDLVAARVVHHEAKPPAATPEPHRSTAEPVRKTKSLSRRAATPVGEQTGRAGDRDDGNDGTRRHTEEGSGGGEQDDGQVSRGGGEAERSGGGEQESDSHESDSDASDTRALAVAEPDEGSDDEKDPGAERSADD